MAAGTLLLAGAVVTFCRAILARASMMAFGASVAAGLVSGKPGSPGPGGGLPCGVVDLATEANKGQIHLFRDTTGMTNKWGQ